MLDSFGGCLVDSVLDVCLLGVLSTVNLPNQLLLELVVEHLMVD